MKFNILTLTIIILSVLETFGQQFSKANGNRDLPFDSVDVQILKRANDILSSESVWSKEDDRKCQDDIESNKYSLFCALYKSSVDIVGEYDHRKPALQQVRWIIDDQYKERLAGHRLMDFNNNAKTSFDEIKKLLQESTLIIEQKIKKAK